MKQIRFWVVIAAAAMSAVVFGFLGCPAEEEGGGTLPELKLDGILITPGEAVVSRGGTYTFTATPVEPNSDLAKAVRWSIMESDRAPGTGITGDGRLIIALAEPLLNLTVQAVSQVDSTKTATANVTVSQAPATVEKVTVTPAGVSIYRNGTHTFSAKVIGENSPSQQVTWTVTGTNKKSGTTIDSNGTLVAAADEPGPLTVKATSTLDTSKYASVQVEVLEALATVTKVTVKTASGATELTRGTIVPMTVTVEGTNNPAQTVTWSILEGDKHPKTLVSSDGILVINSKEPSGTLHVQAASVINTAVTGSVTLGIRGGSTISGVDILTPTASVERGNYAIFNANVNGSNIQDSSVGWSLKPDTTSYEGTGITNDGTLIVDKADPRPSLTLIATSVQDDTKYAEKTVSLTGGNIGSITGISISPSSVEVQQGGYVQFTHGLTVEGNPVQDIVWSILTQGVSTGTGITADGILMVGKTQPLGNLTIQVSAAADSTKTAEAVVTVIERDTGIVDPVVTGVTLTPEAAEVEQGESFDFQAAIVIGAGDPSPAVVWSIEETGLSAGTGVSAMSGGIGRLFVDRNESRTTLTVRATSLEDTDKYKTAAVTVKPGKGYIATWDIIPAAVTVTRGGIFDFVVQATGNEPATAAGDVLWSIPEVDNYTTIKPGTGVSSNGRLIVDSKEPNSSFHVKAVSVSDPSKTTQASITVKDPPAEVSGITITPAGPYGCAAGGDGIYFQASVNGLNNPSQEVFWSIMEASELDTPPGTRKAGTIITADGHLIVASDETLSALAVRVESIQDETMFMLIPVTITQN